MNSKISSIGSLLLRTPFLYNNKTFAFNGTNNPFSIRFYSSFQKEFSTEGEKVIFGKLKESLEPTSLKVTDISGGCGSMYMIEIQSNLFRDLKKIKQHMMINKVLKDDIKEMHGLRIVSGVPENFES
ncbi:BolA-like protein 3 [Smittium culicis]|uniref:BolA-like protein 3 n=1 Tax=Smittium culicis TaxID=133412 RepID=A0A1R1YLY9_9FUNG|nr:BolA-like protein 3 [Smittium culicis]